MASKASGYTRIGLIEVGSRSVRYLVADFDAYSRFSPVAIETYRHSLDPLKIKRDDATTINNLVARADDDLRGQSCDKSIIYGTEICRRMASEFPGTLSDKIRVLSPKEEAMASWAAGLLCQPDINEPVTCTVIDEGNGSTEMVRATWDGKSISDVKFAGFDIGSAELLAVYRSSPNKFLQYLIEKVREISGAVERAGIRSESACVVYLAGGVATKIAWINERSNVKEHYKPHLINGARLSVPYLLRLYSQLGSMYAKKPSAAIEFIDSRRGSEDETPRVISSAPFLAKLRADVAPGDEVLVTGYGVRHGMAFLLNKSIIAS